MAITTLTQSLRTAVGRGRRRIGATLAGIIGILGVAAIWELLRAIGWLPSQWAPSIFDIVGAWIAILVDGGWVVLGSTLVAWLGGLVIASVIGGIWGLAAGSYVVVGAGSRVLIRFLRPVPSIALLPVAILALGLGVPMIMSLVIFASIWPVLFNTLYAYREIPEQYFDTARSLGLTERDTMQRVALIAVLPGLVTGVRVAAGIGLVVTVSAELITGNSGLGGFILEQRTVGDLPAAYAGILMGGILGVLVNSGLVFVQRRALRWSPDNRAVDA
ncbi:ABC transporter permease [Microbacterium sp. UBA837]|uniref:ABC transporter permease n=1 Tax=Microbacterium sp. UBA837 TaxID=1946956 RepID=UPI0025CD3364|nr:ABC transporter permease subunit [Microbacterium sp. UBA837]|tara:strand:+ start:2395 stop:3216 length:822 start_codon:yes stop_codon:yes gene_type:complete